MAEALDWRTFRDQQAERLVKLTGHDVAAWNARIAAAGLHDRPALKAWLADHGVTGYLEMLLRWERFGYPDFITASGDSLVAAQYADRLGLRPIYDAVLAAALALGEVTIQTRKGYVSLLTPRRTFARIQPTTKTRVDVGLRLEGQAPAGRLRPNRIHENMPVGLAFATADELDAEALDWLEKAYAANV